MILYSKMPLLDTVAFYIISIFPAAVKGEPAKICELSCFFLHFRAGAI